VAPRRNGDPSSRRNHGRNQRKNRHECETLLSVKELKIISLPKQDLVCSGRFHFNTGVPGILRKECSGDPQVRPEFIWLQNLPRLSETPLGVGKQLPFLCALSFYSLTLEWAPPLSLGRVWPALLIPGTNFRRSSILLFREK
jgi:hypothetical protein